VLDLTKNVKVVVYFLSLGLRVLEVQFGKSKSIKWKRDWGEHSFTLHCFQKWFHWTQNYHDGSVMVKLMHNSFWHYMESSRYTNVS